MTRHVILAYGRETEHHRAAFAILSFWAWYGGPQPEVRTVVFTDKPALFEGSLAGLPVDYVVLDAERLEALRGPQQYVHRVKAAIIAQVFRDYPGSNVLFCDSDTFFVAEAELLLGSLRPGISLMHQREYRLLDAAGIYAPFHQARFPRRMLEVLDQQIFEVGGTKVRFRPTQYMWNSGVLGLAPDVAALMPDVLILTDAFYAGTGWITSEQNAFSLALQVKTRLETSEEYVLHYWGQRQKRLMDSQLTALLIPTFSEQQLYDRLTQVRLLTLKWQRTVFFATTARNWSVTPLVPG